MINNEIAFAIVFTTLTILALIVSIVIILLFASRQRARQQIRLSDALLKYEKELRAIESEVRENTLTYISGELHDNIGQLLTFMKLQIEKEKLLKPELIPSLDPLANTLQQTTDQVRMLSHLLSNDLIGEGGLQKLIGQEVQRLISLNRFQVHFETDHNEPILEKDMCIVIFRIFQEFISNLMRHSEASNIYITLNGSGFVLKVGDDGKGFDKDAILTTAQGLGLKNVIRRANLAGLQCDLDTQPLKGTMFTITQLPSDK